MDYAQKYKWAVTGFIIMVILNIIVLATIWAVRHDGHQHSRNVPVPFRMQRFMERELNFSKAQKETFRQLRKEHIRESRAIHKEIRQYRRALLGQLHSRKTGQIRVDSLANLIGHAQARLDAAIYNHFVEVRSICDEEQKKKFDRIIRRVIQRLEPVRRKK